MKTGQIVALSFDRPTIPIMDVAFFDENSTYKLTCGWYGHDNRSASVMTTTLNQDNRKELLNDSAMHQRFTSGSILLALKKKIQIQSLKNRDWLLTINLHNVKRPVNVSNFPSIDAFAVDSASNQKIYAAWLMSQLSLQNASTLSDMKWTDIYALFSQINADNPCTIILTDGQDIIFYQGSDFSNSLYYVRSCPPHYNNGLFKTGNMQFQIDYMDLHHTFLLISTEQIQHKDSKFLNLNQMIVVRSGEIIWEHDLNKFEQQSSAEISLPNPELPQDYLRKIHLLKIPYNKASKDSIHFVTVPSESTDTNPRLYSITHESIYEYDSPIYSSKHLFRLQPENDLSQSLLQYRLSVFADKQPVSCLATNFVGAFGNSATFIEVEQVYKLLEVICHSVVSVSTPAPKRFDLLHLTSNIPLIWMPWDRIMMQAYLIPPELPESELRELSDYALSFVKRNNHDVYAVLTDINRTIYQDYTYVSGSSNLHTTPYETYATHRGVCQDFANLFICLARLLNIPSRYRTGYVYTANDYDNQDQGDASHAWLEVYLPYVGWLGFDPTNQCMAEKNHIRVACGRNYSDAAPTSGTIFRGGGKEKLTINVRVLLLDSFDYKK